jgi:CheY-like chemotaxis protein
LIVENDPKDISLIKNLIKKVGILDYVNIHECLWIENNLDASKDLTLKQFIEKNAPIDIAFVDLLFEKEFDVKVIERDGVVAATMIRENFPYCPILFTTNHIDKCQDGTLMAKFDAEHWRKRLFPSYIKTGRNRILSVIKKWMETILSDIKLSEPLIKQCLEMINNNNETEWKKEIVINGRPWTFENLFFIYKDNCSFIYNGNEVGLNVEKLKETLLS